MTNVPEKPYPFGAAHTRIAHKGGSPRHYLTCAILISNIRLGSSLTFQFKADRLQMIVVAKKYISVLQLFISRMPKMCAIPQLVSAPLNPIPIAEHFRRSDPQCEHSYGQHIPVYISEENNAK